MNAYIVKVRTEGFEMYAVDAESEDDARENWHEGSLIQSEADTAWVESVELEADQ